MVTTPIEGPELPMLHSGMFLSPGRLRLDKKHGIEISEVWKLDLWQETIWFYCRLNNMEWTAYTDARDFSLQVSWGNRSQ